MAENNSAEVHALLLAEAYAPAPGGRAGPPTAGGTSSEEDSEDEAAPAGDDGTEIVNNNADGGAAARLQRALGEIEAARERERLLKFRGVARGLENAAWVLDEIGDGDDGARASVWSELSQEARGLLETLCRAGRRDDDTAPAPVPAYDGATVLEGQRPPPAPEESPAQQTLRGRERTCSVDSLDTQGIRELIRDGAARREQTNLRILSSQSSVGAEAPVVATPASPPPPPSPDATVPCRVPNSFLGEESPPAAMPKRARTQPGPAPRWGHSAAVLEDGETMVVWGGEGSDRAVHLYRVATGWECIIGGGDVPDARAWHASVASASRLVVFGGASGDGRPVREGTARVFDLDEGAWTAEECVARPQARLGHTLLSLRDSEGRECVAALGGLRGRDDAITTTCDALQKRLNIKGSVAKGQAPKPHAHGCAVVLRNGAKAVVWTGKPLSKGDKDTPSNKVFVLERDAADTWTWTRMQFVMGDRPSFRSKAACCLLPDGVSVLVHGGLDEETGAVLGDAYVLDTQLWVWSRAPKRVESAFGARAGHSLVCVRDGSWFDARMLLAFGGRGADGSERADLARVTVDERAFKERAVPPAESRRRAAAAAAEAEAATLRGQAEAGNALAMHTLGMMYQDGTLGGAPDPHRAAHWISRAADAGNAPAQRHYGRLLQEGTGVRPDLALATTYLERAAAQGDLGAMASLGVARLAGVGIQKDEQKARRLIYAAASGGHAPSKRLVRCLECIDAIDIEAAAASASFQGLRATHGLGRLAQDLVGSIVAFVDLPMLAAVRATSTSLRDASLRLSPQLEHSLVLHRCPLLATVHWTSPSSDAPAPRELFQMYSGLFEGAAEATDELAPTVTLDAYTISLELEVFCLVGGRRTARESVFVGTQTRPSSETEGNYEFAIPYGVFDNVFEQLVNGPGMRQLNVKVMATRTVSGRLQHAKLYDGEPEDVMRQEMCFEWYTIPRTTESSALRWKEEVGIRTDTFMEPQIHCYWDSAWGPPGTQSARARQKPPSKFLLEFSWNTAHDSNDMNLTDTAMTLEHYVDWK